MSHLIIAPVLLPAVMGALIILWMRNDLLLQRVFSIVGTTLLVGIGIYLNWLAASDQVHVYRLGNWAAPFGIVLVLDRLAALIEGLKTNPGSRRHIFTGWNVADLDRMALPPCHMTYQFHVRSNGGLSCLLFQRSCDLGLGFAFNVFEAALLTRMVAEQCGLHAHELVWTGGDVHLYLNHAELVEQQMGRIPQGAPKLRILRRPDSIFGYNFEDFAVEAYTPQAHIAAPVAV